MSIQITVTLTDAQALAVLRSEGVAALIVSPLVAPAQDPQDRSNTDR